MKASIDFAIKLPTLDVDFAFIFLSLSLVFAFVSARCCVLCVLKFLGTWTHPSSTHCTMQDRVFCCCWRWKTCWYAHFSSFFLSFTAAWRFAVAVQRPVDIKNRPRIPIPDEDPYSVASNELENSGASGSSGEIGRERIAVTKEHLMQQMNGKRSEKPPKLPPRDNIYPQVRVVRVSETVINNGQSEILNFKFHVRDFLLRCNLTQKKHYKTCSLSLSLPLVHIQPDYDDIEDRKISARRKSEKGKNSKSYGELIRRLIFFFFSSSKWCN